MTPTVNVNEVEQKEVSGNPRHREKLRGDAKGRWLGKRHQGHDGNFLEREKLGPKDWVEEDEGAKEDRKKCPQRRRVFSQSSTPVDSRP